MTHSICTSESGELSYFQRLWRTLLTPGIDPRTKIEQLFAHETAEFGMAYAFLSRIDLEEETEHLELVYGLHEALRKGVTIPLSKTYCRKTIAEPEGILAVSDALAEGWGDDPAYETFGLGSYLGTTVSLDDELYGTLCFANIAPRDEPITDEEKALIEMHGLWAEYALHLWNGPPIDGANSDTIEQRAVSSDAIDSMMGALKNRARRVVLMSLLDTAETGIATLERDLDGDYTRAYLHHSHLPKLANAGYINWDSDADTISRGPNFFEVKPLIELLDDYNTMFSE
ncbi:GAF domain-containing protein [Natronomonas halophila]|uniref:GAF domain-containing protein n=1 Tax=Natronomonas halophila TaxID=2747817 RepID=UPI0015B61CB7|nr:GAF domain-containing protein [Natronomonas halophila]QLD86426.1 GAF domain-containing protein [Natronomonas halophila]